MFMIITKNVKKYPFRDIFVENLGYFSAFFSRFKTATFLKEPPAFLIAAIADFEANWVSSAILAVSSPREMTFTFTNGEEMRSFSARR